MDFFLLGKTLSEVLQCISTKRSEQLSQWLKDNEDIEDINGIKKLTTDSLSTLVSKLTVAAKAGTFPSSIPDDLRREFLPFVQQGMFLSFGVFVLSYVCLSYVVS